MLRVTTIIESGGRYPALPAAQSMTTPMLATPAKTTPMLATNNYYQARPDRVEAKKKPAPNAEANEAGEHRIERGRSPASLAQRIKSRCQQLD